MTYWEMYFGDPENALVTIDEKLGRCIMEVIGYECTNNSAVIGICPLYNRCTVDEIVGFLKSEVA